MVPCIDRDELSKSDLHMINQARRMISNFQVQSLAFQDMTLQCKTIVPRTEFHKEEGPEKASMPAGEDQMHLVKAWRKKNLKRRNLNGT